MKIKRIINRLIRGIWYFPKTLYVNFKILPISKAIKLPIIIMSSCYLSGINKNSLEIIGNIRTGMIKFGAKKTSKRGIATSNKTSLIVSDNGKIIFCGGASIGKGTSICAKGGKITIGEGFSCNINCFIYSQKEIIFKKDVLLGWNITVRDNDGHLIYDNNGKLINEDKRIIIGDHVWISSYVDVLKGVSLASGIIVGTKSLVTKTFEQENCIIAGIPSKIKKENVYWKH